MNIYFTVLKKYVEFNGRARRSEFWTFTLLNVIFLILTMGLDFMIGINIKQLPFGTICIIYTLLVFLPGLAVFVRRMHDVGKNGWYILLSFIPVVGIVWLLSLCITESSVGVNMYGANPIETLSTER